MKKVLFVYDKSIKLKQLELIQKHLNERIELEVENINFQKSSDVVSDMDFNIEILESYLEKYDVIVGHWPRVFDETIKYMREINHIRLEDKIILAPIVHNNKWMRLSEI